MDKVCKMLGFEESNRDLKSNVINTWAKASDHHYKEKNKERYLKI